MNSILKELYCISESPLDVLNVDFVIYYRGHKFPRRAKVLLQPGSDAAFSSLNSHSARKIAVLFVV